VGRTGGTHARIRDDVVRLTNRGLPVEAFARAVGTTLARAVPAEGACLMTVDPATLLPTAEYPRALGLATAVFAAVAAWAHRLGRRGGPPVGVFAVAVSTGVFLVMPTFPAMGGTTVRAVPLGFLGMQAAALLWAALTWPPQRPARERTSLRSAWTVGAIMATVLSAIATIPIGIGLLTRDAELPGLLLVYPAYYIGLLAAATCYWLLQRVAHLATGRYFIGALGGTCVYLAVWPVVALLKGEPMMSPVMLAVSTIPGGLVGPTVALSITDDLVPSDAAEE